MLDCHWLCSALPVEVLGQPASFIGRKLSGLSYTDLLWDWAEGPGQPHFPHENKLYGMYQLTCWEAWAALLSPWEQAVRYVLTDLLRGLGSPASSMRQAIWYVLTDLLRGLGSLPPPWGKLYGMYSLTCWGAWAPLPPPWGQMPNSCSPAFHLTGSASSSLLYSVISSPAWIIHIAQHSDVRRLDGRLSYSEKVTYCVE
jgi:hypothetical protein